MTEYSYNVNKNCIEKDERFFAYVNTIDANRIVKLLNEQEKRIKELEQENKQLKQGKYIYGIHGGSNDRK